MAPAPTLQEYLEQQQHKALGGRQQFHGCGRHGQRRGALGRGWVREDELRATLNAIERELALAMPPGGSWPPAACCVLVLVGSRTTPFLRRHGVAALRLQLWQLLLVPTPVLFWFTLGTYTVIALAALLGGIGYAVLGAVRALTGDERAYPRDWPARAGPVPVEVGPARRERRARWALGVLVIVVLVRVVLVRLPT